MHGRYALELKACLPPLAQWNPILEHELDSGFEVAELSIFSTTYLRSLDELVRTAVSSLEQHAYTAAENLSRTAIEQAGTLVYVLDDSEGDRLHALLRRYLDETALHGSRWSANAAKRGDSNDQRLAAERIDNVNRLREVCGCPWGKLATAWRMPIDRLDDTFFAPQYYYLTANAAIAEHALSESILNDMLCSRMPEVLRADTYRTLKSEKRSWVVFLVAYAAWFQCNVLLWLAKAVGIQQAVVDLETLNTTLVRIIDELEAKTASFRSSLLPGRQAG